MITFAIHSLINIFSLQQMVCVCAELNIHCGFFAVRYCIVSLMYYVNCEVNEDHVNETDVFLC